MQLNVPAGSSRIQRDDAEGNQLQANQLKPSKAWQQPPQPRKKESWRFHAACVACRFSFTRGVAIFWHRSVRRANLCGGPNRHAFPGHCPSADLLSDARAGHIATLWIDAHRRLATDDRSTRPDERPRAFRCVLCLFLFLFVSVCLRFVACVGVCRTGNWRAGAIDTKSPKLTSVLMEATRHSAQASTASTSRPENGAYGHRLESIAGADNEPDRDVDTTNNDDDDDDDDENKTASAYFQQDTSPWIPAVDVGRGGCASPASSSSPVRRHLFLGSYLLSLSLSLSLPLSIRQISLRALIE